MEVNRSCNDRRRSLWYASSGLEMYDDCSEDLSMTVLDFIHGFDHHLLPLHVVRHCLHVCDANCTRTPHIMFHSSKISSIVISLLLPLTKVLRILVWEKESSGK